MFVRLRFFWPSWDDNKYYRGVVPFRDREVEVGVKLLGGADSRDNNFIEKLAMKRAFYDCGVNAFSSTFKRSP
jgi:hypothetical protein